MSGFQIMVMMICLLISIAEGYDLLLMAFAASGVAAEWSLNGAQIGLLLSSALIGMAFGSAFIAPLADRIGRRMQVLGCLLLVVITMAIAAFSANVVQLGVCRFLTGLGVGVVSAIGRLGAIVSPIIAGLLIDLAWTPESLFMLFAIPLVLGAVMVALIKMPARASDTAAEAQARKEPAVR